MITRIKFYFAAIGAFVVMVVTTWLSLKRANDAEQKAEQAENRLKVVHRAQEIKDEVEILDDVGLSARAAKWLHEKQ